MEHPASPVPAGRPAGRVRGRGSRDRRGRGVRGPLAWPAVPAMTTRARAFDELVLDAVERLEQHLGRRLDELEVGVEEVPPSDPAAWEDGVPLGRLFPAVQDEPARLVIYRRPVTARAADPDDLAALVRAVLADQVAGLLGLPPEDLEP